MNEIPTFLSSKKIYNYRFYDIHIYTDIIDYRCECKVEIYKSGCTRKVLAYNEFGNFQTCYHWSIDWINSRDIK